VQILEFLAAVALLTLQLALVVGTLAGLFLFACFAVGWLIEAVRRLK
jgi:hypothetical protein